MNPILENLIWSHCGPHSAPLTFRQLQTMTGMDSEAIARALRSTDVEAVWVSDLEQIELNETVHYIRLNGHLAYRPSAELIRRTLWETIRPFSVADSEPSNVIRINVA